MAIWGFSKVRYINGVRFEHDDGRGIWVALREQVVVRRHKKRKWRWDPTQTAAYDKETLPETRDDYPTLDWAARDAVAWGREHINGR